MRKCKVEVKREGCVCDKKRIKIDGVGGGSNSIIVTSKGKKLERDVERNRR